MEMVLTQKRKKKKQKPKQKGIERKKKRINSNSSSRSSGSSSQNSSNSFDIDVDNDEEDYKLERPKTVPSEYMNKNTKIHQNDEKIFDDKANSDIYPVSKLKNKQSTASDALRFNEECLTIQDYNTLIKNEGRGSIQSGSTEKRKEKILKPVLDKVVQVNKYDINKEIRNLMDPEVRFKLEFAEMLTETLANCALLAGSSDNITLNCVLLPGWNA